MSSAMADSEHSYSKTRFPRELNPSVELKGTKSAGKVLSFTHFFRKFLLFALFLIAIPLFPAQAPDFINQTVLTKFWELVHLLFIGIVVSYGLLCQRNVDVEIETQPNTDDSQSYMSRVFQVSSIFEDGFDNSYGYAEKNVYENLYSENYKGDRSKPRSLNCEIGSENLYGYGENNVSQAWNSQYFQGESTVIVNQENCAVNEYCRKSLGLPVRSLRSRVRNLDSSEISDGNESGSIATESSNSPPEGINKTFGDLDPMNLEHTFNESAAADALSLPIPWRSMSERMEMRENMDIAFRPPHFRPLSVDETQFESLKSQSFWSSETFSSQNSSVSESPSKFSPSHTGSSELENFKMEELGKEKTFLNSSPPVSKPENGKTSLNAFHIRRYTNGSLFEKNVRKSFENDSKDRGGNKIEDQLGSSREWRSSSLNMDRPPAKLAKASSRGKSVRTIRSRGFASESMKSGERSGKPGDGIEAAYKGKSKMKSGGFFDNLSANIRKQDLDKHSSMPNPTDYEMKSGGFSDIVSENPRKQGLDNQVSMSKPTHSELQKRKNKEPSENVAVEPEEKSRHAAENFQVKSDEQSVTDSVNDAESDANEVDKKAGEFIAKFREQIRLQKMASIDKSSREFHHFR
ncbi:putative Hydroxyproline-rich glycoprotein family protein [Melia azedarach]|uniref:Hydroxyproline-rich glycoprotein family protein n=2 Tax=Melia azedarach TaxID=155640 RepID=A0ACC1YUV7_MELAZ|nr:putative Hydroxyproline-rich glycoprotein family protein [Melia azedarach]KAJ4727247.1 putative Hydroxyproline-rich glycoprotein family protein [Melia azedarach]